MKLQNTLSLSSKEIEKLTEAGNLFSSIKKCLESSKQTNDESEVEITVTLSDETSQLFNALKKVIDEIVTFNN